MAKHSKSKSSKKSSGEAPVIRDSFDASAVTDFHIASAPEPPPPLVEELTVQAAAPLVPDFGLQISLSAHARIADKNKKSKKSKKKQVPAVTAAAATVPRIQRPIPSGSTGSRPQLSAYQRAKSLRQLPTAPPPPPPPPSGMLQKSMSTRTGIATSISATPTTSGGGTSGPGRLGMQAPSHKLQRGGAQSMRQLKAAPPPPLPPAPPSFESLVGADQRAQGMKRGVQSMRHIGAGGAAAAPAGSSQLGPNSRQSSSPSLKQGGGSSWWLVSPPPPVSMAPEVLAEGVPLSAGAAALPPLHESASGGMDTSAKHVSEEQDKKKKKKKAKEQAKLLETFDDEYPNDGASVCSEDEESLTANEKADQKESEVKNTLFWAALNALGMIFVMTVVGKLIKRFSNSEDVYTAEDEILNVAGNAVPTPPPPPPGTTAAVNAGMAQQMAVAAGQSAAASTAAGAGSTVTAAAAAATVTSVTSVSFVGVAAVGVTGVGMATGVIPVPAFLTTEHTPCHQFVDSMTARPGDMVLHLAGLPQNFFNIPKNTDLMQEAFVEAYNKVLGTCVAHMVPGHNDTNITDPLDNVIPQDVYARFMENATVDGWDYWNVVDQETGEVIQYFTTEWTAFVGCDDKDGHSLGCSPIEPLFYEGDFEQRTDGAPEEPVGVVDTNGSAASTRRRDLLLSSPEHVRWLQTLDPESTKSNMQLFMETLATELQDLLVTNNPNDEEDEIDIFYGASLSTNVTATESHSIVEASGTSYNAGTLVAGNGANGAVDRPQLTTCTRPNGKPIASAELKEGYIRLGFQGVDESFFTTQQELLQQTFRSVYNEVMEGCDGDYYRVLQKAELTGSSTRDKEGQVLLSSEWTATLSCAGCFDHEPLFADHKASPAASDKKDGKGRRQLAIQSDAKLAEFANKLAEKITILHQEVNKEANTAEAYFAAALDQDGVVVEGAGVEDPFANKHDVLVDCATDAAPAADAPLVEGKFELYVMHLVNDINQTIVQAVVQDIYNDLSGMCDGPYERVAHEVIIDDWKHEIVNDRESFVAFNARTKLTCTGCQAEDIEEPMFLDGVQDASRRMLQEMDTNLFERFREKLTNELNLLLRDFKSTIYWAPGVSLFENSNADAMYPSVDVVFGATYGRNGQVVQTVGTPLETNEPEPVMVSNVVPIQPDPTLAPTEAPVTLSPTQPDVTPAPTEAPVTMAPTTSPTTVSPTAAPTAAPTASPTLAPTGAPSTLAPTTTRIVRVSTEWKLVMTPNDRAATDAELADFVTTASTWLTEESTKAYQLPDNEAHTFVSQESSLLSSDWKQDPALDYNIAIVTESDYIFLGDPQPTAQSVSGIIVEFDLGAFVQAQLWKEDVENAWIWDLVEGATIAAANVRVR